MNLVTSHATDEPAQPIGTLECLEKMTLSLNGRLDHCFPCLPEHLFRCLGNDLTSKTIFLLIQEHLEVSISA